MKPEKVVSRAVSKYRDAGRTRHTATGIDESTGELMTYSWIPGTPCPIPVEVDVIVQLSPGELDPFAARLQASYGAAITEREAQMLVLRPRVVRALLRPPKPPPVEKPKRTYAIKHFVHDEHGYINGTLITDQVGIVGKDAAVAVARELEQAALVAHRSISGHALRDKPRYIIVNELTGRLYSSRGVAYWLSDTEENYCETFRVRYQERLAELHWRKL